MPAIGEIRTLYLDKDRTQALFPRTKTSAISDADNRGLDTVLADINTALDGKAPAGYIEATYWITDTDPTAANSALDNILLEAYTATADRAIKHICIFDNTGASTLAGGCWMMSIFRTSANHGCIEAIRYETNGTSKLTRSMYDGYLQPWVNQSASAFAPAGYGLGGGGKDHVIYDLSDLDILKSNGWYTIHRAASTPNPFVIGGVAFNAALVEVSFLTLDYGYQKLRHLERTGTLTRYYAQGTWGEWEWDNPPMEAGVEYRTTERWEGKPVYTKLVNIGALPNATGKYIENSILPMGITVITAYGVGIGGKHSVAIPTRHIHLSIDGEWGTIYISTDSDYSNYTGYIVAKYVKD